MGATYKWDAKDYAKNSTAQFDWANELIDKLTLCGEEHVLDVGCGDGKVSAALSRRLSAGSVLGIDSSEQMVALAGDNFPQNEYGNLSFAQADARALVFDGEFDVVFSNAALHWIRGHEPVLAGVARGLTTGGRFLLQMGGQGNVVDLIAVLDEMIARAPWGEYFADFTFPYGFYGPEEYTGWLAQGGLVPDRLELIPKDMVHKNAAALVGWVRTTWLPYTQRVPEARRESFVEELIESYLAAHPPDSEGRTHVRMVRLEVEGHKAA